MTKGVSLHVGLNRVDPEKYGGWEGKLLACENDAKDMARLAKDAGFGSRTVLLSEEATVENVTAELRRAAGALSPGDILFFTYSGHGAQVPDANGPEDEPDRLDETLVLFDREYVDDELFREFEGLAEGVRVLSFLDSCHSGTGTRVREILNPQSLEDQFQTKDPHQVEAASRLMPLDKQAEVYQRDKEFYDTLQRELDAKDTRDLGATVLLISGCQDNQLSADGLRNGLFTGTLLQVWNGGKFPGGYKAFHHAILERMPPNQTPNFFVTGRANKRFVRQRPFTV